MMEDGKQQSLKNMSGGTCTCSNNSSGSCSVSGSARREWDRTHSDGIISQWKSKSKKRIGMGLAGGLLLMHFVIMGVWIISANFCMHNHD